MHLVLFIMLHRVRQTLPFTDNVTNQMKAIEQCFHKEFFYAEQTG